MSLARTGREVGPLRGDLEQGHAYLGAWPRVSSCPRGSAPRSTRDCAGAPRPPDRPRSRPPVSRCCARCWSRGPTAPPGSPARPARPWCERRSGCRRPGPGRSGSARPGASSCPRRRRDRGKPCASPPRAPPPPHRAVLRPGPRPRLQRPLQAHSAARASGRRRPRRLARSLAGPAHGERRAGAIRPGPLTRTTSTRRAAPPGKPAPRADPRALGHPHQVRAWRSPSARSRPRHLLPLFCASPPSPSL